MPLSSSSTNPYFYPQAQKPNSSYPKVVMRGVATQGAATGAGSLYVLSSSGGLRYIDPDGNDLAIADATGSAVFDVIDVHGTVNNTTGDLILSSSATSVIFFSGSLYMMAGTNIQTAGIGTLAGAWSVGNYLKSNQLRTDLLRTKDAEHLILSSSIGKVHASGTFGFCSYPVADLPAGTDNLSGSVVWVSDSKFLAVYGSEGWCPIATGSAI